MLCEGQRFDTISHKQKYIHMIVVNADYVIDALTQVPWLKKINRNIIWL